MAGFLLALASGCHDVTNLDPTVGRDIGVTPAEVIDAGPADAYESPRRDGSELDDGATGAIDAALPPGPDAGPDGGALDEAACNACEAASCRDVDGLDLYAACFQNSDPAGDGPGAGMPKSTLCQAVLHCARVTGCAENDPQPCFCGAGVSDLQCLAGMASGPCKHEIEVAAETSNAGSVAERLSDPSYASGAAFNLLRYCEAPTCHASCTGGPHTHPPDAGPPPDAPPPPPPDAAPPHSCADLDTDGRSDCSETLLANAALPDGTAGWTAEFGSGQSWDRAADGLNDTTSGSIIVENTVVVAASGVTMTGSSQCVPAQATTGYRAGAHVLVPSGQGAGAAAINVQFFASPDCQGVPIGAWTSADAPAPTGAWNVLVGSFASVAGTQSLRVRLVVVKPFDAPALHARFDDVLLEKP